MNSMFDPLQLGPQHGPQLILPIALLARVSAPAVVHPDLIARVHTYREAVRLCFALRRRKGMHAKLVASEAGIHPPHISEFLSADDSKREMPAKYVPAFERVCGNTAISQWLASQAALTVLEEMQARRVA